MGSRSWADSMTWRRTSLAPDVARICAPEDVHVCLYEADLRV